MKKILLAALCGALAMGTVAYATDLTTDQVRRLKIAFADSDTAEALADAANVVDGVTAGTALGSSAMVLSSAKTITGVTQFQSGAYQMGIYPSVITASADISTATLQSYNYFRVATHAGAVDLDFGEDAQFPAAWRGARWKFTVEGGGTNALTVTAGTTVSTIKTIEPDGTTCEDEGDFIEVMVYSTAHATIVKQCAD